jgi:hypothetical protein
MTSQLEWNKLLEFESRDLIERYFNHKHNRKASARQISEISANFIQGREYFRNALNADITVKPLLLYYGVASLTRGLILADSPKTSEASMKPSHGLDTISWQESLVTGDFGALAVSIKKGTYFEMLTTTANRAYFKHNTSAIGWHVDYPVPAENQKFTFDDLIQTMPDLENEYYIWRQSKLHRLSTSGFHSQDDGSKEYIVYPPKKDPEAINYIFPKTIAGVGKIDDNGNLVTIQTNGDYLAHFSQKFELSIGARIGEVHLTRPINYETYLSPLAQLYAASFYMGMLCRYFPSIWIGIGRMQKGDAIYPLFSKIIEITEKFFPAVVVDYLNGPYAVK